MAVDLQKIILQRTNRATRLDRPFSNYFEILQQCKTAGESLLEGKIPAELTPIFERSVIITAVSATEVYYRDMLDFIFKYCSPSFFEKVLTQLHPDKYNITDIIEIYRNRVHPLELVVSSQSFQSISAIDKVFSKFVSKSIWASLFELKVRTKDEPDNVLDWSPDNLEDLNWLFEKRHELVHNPARTAFFDEETIQRLYVSALMVFGTDIIISKVINENKDPELDNE